MPQPRKHLEHQHYELIEKLAARGCAERTIARACGVGWTRWHEVKKRDRRCVEALERGRAVEHDALVGSLFQAATEKGIVTAAIFLLKCRHNYCDTPPPTPPSTTSVEVVIQVPAPLTPEQYRKVLDVTPHKALEGRKDG